MDEKKDYTSGGRESSPGFTGGVDTDPLGSITQTVKDASRAALDEAKSLGSDAQDMAADQADEVKDIATSHLDAFADALKGAAEELKRKQSGPASEMISHAAAGLESLSRSMQGQSAGQMVGTLREFGRANPLGFLAGSILAGVALGRFAAAGSNSETSTRPTGTVSSFSTTTHADRGNTP